MGLRRLGIALAAGTLALVSVAVGLYLFFNLAALDNIVYGTPLRNVPEPAKEALRPWRAPQILKVSPLGGTADVKPNLPITVTFSTPMDREAVERSFRVTPQVRGTFTWSDNTLVFTPSEPWPLQSKISVSLGEGVRSWA